MFQEKEKENIQRVVKMIIMQVTFIGIQVGGAIMWVVSGERWAMSGKLWAVRDEKYLELHPILSYNRGILAQLIAYLSIILEVGSANKMQQT